LNMKSVAIYTRVSSEQQKEGQTIESQVAALREYAQAEGYGVVDEWVFRDEGYSGATLVRPGLERVCRRRLKVDDFGRNESGWITGKKRPAEIIRRPC